MIPCCCGCGVCRTNGTASIDIALTVAGLANIVPGDPTFCSDCASSNATSVFTIPASVSPGTCYALLEEVWSGCNTVFGGTFFFMDITISNPLGGTTAELNIHIYGGSFGTWTIMRGAYTLTVPIEDCANAGPFSLTVTDTGDTGDTCDSSAATMTVSFV